MSKFRKKPIVIEAWQHDGSMAPNWVADACSERALVTLIEGDIGSLFIPTLEGVMEAKHGDWIIKGVKGEVYPCKPDIFAATYEPAE